MDNYLISEKLLLKLYRKIPKPWNGDFREAIRDKLKFIGILDNVGDYIKQQRELIVLNTVLLNNRLFLRRNLKVNFFIILIS